ncbi:MAG TPA: alpha/beta fold hydrolase [Solirubrobacteraceae bacterium]|jgi:S-formylglutathione hydrolase FrmB
MRRVLLAVVLVLAGCGEPEGSSTLEQRSRAVGETLEHRVYVPEGASDHPPLLVLLHGRGGDAKSMISDALVDALDEAGDRAPVVLSPDGGDSSYWHNRRDGKWARMVIREAIPAAIERTGADPERIAIGGISMGGFGALHLAAAFPERFCAVGAHSPAIFAEAGLSAAGAFDDAEDFDRHDLIARASQIPRGAWVDVGDQDPFAPAVRTLVARMDAPRFHPWKGGHDGDYWNAHTDEYVDFYVRELERCGKRG